MASRISRKLITFDDPIACIATCPVSRKIAAWSSRQQCSVFSLRQSDWVRDERTAEMISFQLRKYIEADAYITVGANWHDDRVLMVIDTKFSLKNCSQTLIALDVDLNDSNASRIVYTGDICAAYIPEPVFVGKHHIFVGLRNGLLHYSRETKKTAWIGRVDSEPLDDVYFAPDGLYYQAANNILHTITYDLQGPVFIHSYHLNAAFSVTKQDMVVVDAEREEHRAPYERSNIVATCRNSHTGQMAYLMAPDEWSVTSQPRKGSQIPIAHLYIGNPIRSATKMSAYGTLGVNVNGRRVEPDMPMEKPAYWVSRISTEPARMFLEPLESDQYLLGLTGGTLCLLNTQTGSQKVVMQMPAEISALKPAFKSSDFLVGLMNGELHLVHISPDA